MVRVHVTITVLMIYNNGRVHVTITVLMIYNNGRVHVIDL